MNSAVQTGSTTQPSKRVSRAYRTLKPSARGDLMNLSREDRNKLHEWFREKDGNVQYKEIVQRLKTAFGIRAAHSTLSAYYHRHHAEIFAGAPEHSAAQAASRVQTILIRIEVPPGCSVDVSRTAAEGSQQ